MTLWGVASTGCKVDVKKLPLKGEVRRDASRQECLAWVRGSMVSQNKAEFNLRETKPLPRNILHTFQVYGAANEPNESE